MSEKRFTNREVADTFSLIGDLLEIKGEIVYKVLAYRKAADSLNNQARDINEIWRRGELQEIPGVGKAIAEKIDELLSTGQIQFLERTKKEVPASLVELLRIPDLGPKKVALFWKELGIRSIAELEEAARSGKLRSLPGMGEKSETKVLAGLEMLARRSDRIPLGKAWPAAREQVAFLMKLRGVKAADVGGSLRRGRATVGDLDLLAGAEDPEAVIQAFITQPSVHTVLSQGDVKASVEFNNRLRAQLWVYKPERWGSALVYATGSKDHNVRLREIAQNKGLSLSDRGFLHPDGTEVFCSTEEDVYEFLGLPWIPPELREDRGEIEAARKGKLPNLLEREDVVAELHAHTRWSDGKYTILEMAQAARERGHRVLAITDHSGGLGIAGGLSAERLDEQRAAIQEAQRELGDSIRLLQGTEVEIKADGGLDYPDEVLARLDLVIASLHVGLRQTRAQVTERMLATIRNPHVDIIGHPSGRLLPDREGADLDMDAVLEAAADSGVALEINAHPQRLDLEDIYVRRAVELCIPLSLNTDAHGPADMDLLHFGVTVARRGWAEPEDVINTWGTDRLLDWLEKRDSNPKG